MKKSYIIDNVQIFVTWQEILPKDKTISVEKTVIFFPGWPLKGHRKTTQKIAEDIAYHTGRKIYILNTRTNQVITNSLYREAMAVCSFIEENKLEFITIIGYSQGGIKAINTANILQETHCDISIEGVILLCSLGLVQISRTELFKSYVFDLLVKNLFVIIRDSIGESSIRKKALSILRNARLISHVTIDFFLSLFSDIKTSGLHYLNTLKNEIYEMAEMSAYSNRISAPIILIQGTWDSVSDSRKMISLTEMERVQKKLLHADNPPLLNEIAGNQTVSKKIFPQSSYVKIVRVKKFGVHLLPFYRSNSIARATFYLLRRHQREINTKLLSNSPI